MKNLGFIAAISLTLGIGSIVNTASAQSAECSGLSGAAFGLCTAANAVECDGSDFDAMGCDRIEARFEEITGTTPPWTLPACSCGTTADFIAHVEDSEATSISCLVLISPTGQNDVLAINTEIQIGSVATHLPPLNFSFKHTCAFDNFSLFTLDTNEEAQSCANNIVNAAANFGAICTGL